MIKYLFKTSFRYIWFNKKTTLLSITGLAVTLTVFILLGTYVVNELNMGKDMPNSSKILRLQQEKQDRISYKMFELVKNIPEIDRSTFVTSCWTKKQIFLFRNQMYDAGKVLFSDNNFFEVFPYKPIVGNLNHALDNSDGIVLTKSMATKLFGLENAVGQEITFRDNYWGDMKYQVSAIIEDLPRGDLFQFSCILSHKSIENKVNFQSWGTTSYEGFVIMKNSRQFNQEVTDKLNLLYIKNAPDWIKTDNPGLLFKPLVDLYFDASPEELLLIHNNKNIVRSIGLLAFLVLLAGMINFINLNTAQKQKKSKNMAIIHVNGAPNSYLYFQILIEAWILVVISLAISILIVALSFPLFNILSGRTFGFTLFMQFLFNKGYWLVPIVLAGLSGLVTAIYFQLSKEYLIFRSSQTSKENFRNGLLLTQFFVSMILIVGTLVINKQNNYMLRRSTGFNKEGIICIPMVKETRDHCSSFQSEMLKISGVSMMAYASSLLGQADETWGVNFSNNGQDRRILYNAIRVDSTFFRLMGFKMIEGQGFNSASIRENHHIFNQEALKEYEISDITKARITSFGGNGNIVGVVKDFNFESYHFPIKPMAFILEDPKNLNYVYIKLSDMSSANISKVISEMRGIWKQFAPAWPFEYIFFDQSLDKLYEKDKDFGNIAFAMTILVVFLACLGLLGIAMFQIESKTKEIGIRKVNGATISEVMILLNKDFVKWVIIAFVIAVPVAWYAMHRWLENFAYKTELSWWIFALAGLIALVIALLTVSWQSWKAATSNPVEALRSE